jgi:acetylornithine deacetylase
LGLEPYGSPTLSNQALLSIPTLKMGPGDSARSHTANEYIRISEIREGIRLYAQLLDGLKL